MKLINKTYISVLIYLSLALSCLTFFLYIQRENIAFSDYYMSPKKDDGKEAYEFVTDCYSVEDAAEAIGYPILKEYDFGSDIFFISNEGMKEYAEMAVLYRYDSNEKKLYRGTEDGAGSVSSDLIWQEGGWYDYELAESIIYTFDDANCYMVGDDSHDDVYYGIWYGDEIDNIRVKKGKFEYSFLGTFEEDDSNVYFWTYELNNSRELLSQVFKPRPNDSFGGSDYHIRDVKNLLGIKSKYKFDARALLYVLVTAVLLVINVLLIVTTYRLNNTEGKIAIKVPLWILTIILSVVVSILILYFAFNPRLVFSNSGINELFHKLTGHYIPNPQGFRVRK